MTTKRLLKELATQDLPPGIVTLQPDPDNMLQWSATIEGPPGTAYADTFWDLEISVPPNYPLEPPKITFVTLSDDAFTRRRQQTPQTQQMPQTQQTPLDGSDYSSAHPRCFCMPHPNVAFKTGEICLDILQRKWSPAWTLQSAVMAIVVLLGDPEPLSPLNVDMANLLKCGDQLAYDGVVRYYCANYSI